MKAQSKTKTVIFALFAAIFAALPVTAGVRFDSIGSNATERWTLTLPSHERTLISVVGDGDTDLDIWLYDEHGNLVDCDTDATDTCVVSVCPRYAGKFTLKIKNFGNVYNRYRLEVD